MTFTSTQPGFKRLEDSEKLLRAIFPNYLSLEPCHSAPRLERFPIAAKTMGTKWGYLSGRHVALIRVCKALQV